MENRREDFDFFIRNKDAVYLDNAATTLCPNVVVESMSDCYKYNFTNINRGIYPLAEETFDMVLRAKKNIIDFFGGKEKYDVIFSTGTTDSINIIARSYVKKILKKGDVIMISPYEHHSNFLPWKILCKEKEAKLLMFPVDSEGMINVSAIPKDICEKIRFIALTHVSNVTGIKLNVEDVISYFKEKNIPILIDGAQSSPHYDIKLDDLECDFFACSAHKMLGPFGVGAIFVKKQRLIEMDVNNTGGGMVLDIEKLIWKEKTDKFAAGTINTVGIIGWNKAIEYLNNLNHSIITKSMGELQSRLYSKLNSNSKVQMYSNKDNNSGVISFNVGNIHPHDVAAYLYKKNIMVRVGNHCSIPTMKYLNIKSCIRASLYIYNSNQDIECLIEEIDKLASMC